MGNCSGLFANCNGEQAKDPVHKIDAAGMAQALRENKMRDEAGLAMMQAGRD